MGGNGVSLKTIDGNLKWVGGLALGVQPQDGENEKNLQIGAGVALNGLFPKQLGFVYAAPNYLQAAGQKQLGVTLGGGFDLLLTTLSVGVNPGINLGTGEFTLGGEITAGPLIGIFNKDWALIPAFKMTWPDFFTGVGNGSAFYGLQLTVVYGHLPEDR